LTGLFAEKFHMKPKKLPENDFFGGFWELYGNRTVGCLAKKT
jgi:hypothetical protein